MCVKDQCEELFKEMRPLLGVCVLLAIVLACLLVFVRNGDRPANKYLWAYIHILLSFSVVMEH